MIFNKTKLTAVHLFLDKKDRCQNSFSLIYKKTTWLRSFFVQLNFRFFSCSCYNTIYYKALKWNIFHLGFTMHLFAKTTTKIHFFLARWLITFRSVDWTNEHVFLFVGLVFINYTMYSNKMCKTVRLRQLAQDDSTIFVCCGWFYSLYDALRFLSFAPRYCFACTWIWRNEQNPMRVGIFHAYLLTHTSTLTLETESKKRVVHVNAPRFIGKNIFLSSHFESQFETLRSLRLYISQSNQKYTNNNVATSLFWLCSFFPIVCLK